MHLFVKNIFYICSMKKTYFILLLFLSSSLFAQDYIILHSGQEIKARILDFHQSTVSYRNFDDMAGKIVIIEKKDILLIKYQDGSTVVMKNSFSNSDTTEKKTFLKTDLEAIAIKDAKENYTTALPAIESGCCTAACIPIGLPTATIIASQPPKIDNLNIPKEYQTNKEYITYYTKEAHKIKRKKILISTAIGIPVNIIIIWFIYF